MLSSKWGGRGHFNKKKNDDRDKKVKKAGDGMGNDQITIQKSKSEDVEAELLAIALGGNNLTVPFNINIANTSTGGSINKESGKGDLEDEDEASLF
ncbi:hypothetical protein [Mesobacillus foraminis]|uniref:Uncharacterized protein n=1 Tax=Mesobacillus foraminis TaxID=279826 RepID=A0A4R2BKS1_9BACI|nr:hypothetical protein [Mesobacillus foraminis]TCN27828.1 hypothetical protein EV146_101156 [Mesobacillus foraminis]